jgi:hypothetical protein
MLKNYAAALLLCLPALANAELIRLNCVPNNGADVSVIVEVNTVSATISANGLPGTDVAIAEDLFFFRQFLNGISYVVSINRGNGAMSVLADGIPAAWSCSRIVDTGI